MVQPLYCHLPAQCQPVMPRLPAPAAPPQQQLRRSRRHRYSRMKLSVILPPPTAQAADVADRSECGVEAGLASPRKPALEHFPPGAAMLTSRRCHPEWNTRQHGPECGRSFLPRTGAAFSLSRNRFHGSADQRAAAPAPEREDRALLDGASVCGPAWSPPWMKSRPDRHGRSAADRLHRRPGRSSAPPRGSATRRYRSFAAIRGAKTIAARAAEEGAAAASGKSPRATAVVRMWLSHQ